MKLATSALLVVLASANAAAFSPTASSPAHRATSLQATATEEKTKGVPAGMVYDEDFDDVQLVRVMGLKRLKKIARKHRRQLNGRIRDFGVVQDGEGEWVVATPEQSEELRSSSSAAAAEAAAEAAVIAAATAAADAAALAAPAVPPADRSVADPSSPPADDPRVAQTEMMIKDAAALLSSEGSEAFDRLRNEEQYRDETKYVFAYDLDCNVLFNGAWPEKEGHNTDGLTDINGKTFHNELASVDGSGWVNYTWPKPGEEEGSLKWTYATRVTIDGVEAVVMSGFYL